MLVLPLLLVKLRMVLLDVSSAVACCRPKTATVAVKATAAAMEAIECTDVVVVMVMQWLRVEVVR